MLTEKYMYVYSFLLIIPEVLTISVKLGSGYQRIIWVWVGLFLLNTSIGVASILFSTYC